MGICGPPPKAKIRHTFRKPNGKTLNANRRNKLLHLLKAERNKGKTFGGKLPRNSAVDNRPSTSAGDCNYGTTVDDIIFGSIECQR